MADVRTTLGSVHRMIIAGNRVHFELRERCVERVESGKRTAIEEKNGMFEIGVWVPRTRECAGEENHFVADHSNRSNSVNESSFMRQDEGKRMALLKGL